MEGRSFRGEALNPSLPPYQSRSRYDGQPVCADPTADPKENETGIHFAGGDRLAWISSYEPAVINGLLKHKHFRLSEVITLHIDKQECVVGVTGRIPIGALRIGRRRASDRHDLIVSPR